MTNIDDEFIKDLDKCLKIADQLSKLETDEAKLFVSTQLNDLHKFLQKKQQDAEERIEEEMKKEENEIEQLKKRIDRAKTSNGESESDIAYTDITILWSELKDEYWRSVFNAFISETKDSVEKILKNLIGILMACFTKCKERASKGRTELKFQVYYPGEDPSNKNLKLPKERDQHLDKQLEGLCRRCQLRSTPFCIESILKAIGGDVRQMKDVSNHLKYKSKELPKEIQKYLDKCIEFCWVACLQQPAIQLVTKPKKECPRIANEFKGLDQTIYGGRKDAAYVEWPAIVQEDTIRAQWHLYPVNHPRPEPKDLRGEQSADYRVAGIEGTDGKLKDDPDDKIGDDENTKPFQANNGIDKFEGKSEKRKTESPVSGDGSNDKETNNKKSTEYKQKNQGHPNARF